MYVCLSEVFVCLYRLSDCLRRIISAVITQLTVSHQFGLSLQQIMDVDEKDQIMMTNVWLNLVISYLVATAHNIQRLARIGWLVASGNRK